MPIKTISMLTIETMDKTKGELFAAVNVTFDYALPQTWLDDFSEWCKRNASNVTYTMIASTTVWAYPPREGHFGQPLTVCLEVEQAYTSYCNSKGWSWTNNI